MGAQRVETVAIACLRFGLSPRVRNCDPDHAATLAEVLDEVPPILVHAPTMRVIDGVHRVHAARRAGHTTIRAQMFDGDETAAVVEAVRSNVAHGKPLTFEERQAAVVRILGDLPDWSDRRVAGVTGLAPKTVARLRCRATGDGAQLSTREGRDGRRRPMDPTGLRREVVEALQANPDASNRAIARFTGASQATVRDVKERLSRGETGLLPAQATRQTEDRLEGLLSPDPPQSPLPATVCPKFINWFEQRHIDEVSWQPFVDDLPFNTVYTVADECRRRSDNWRAFAGALEDRARTHRRSRKLWNATNP